MAGVRSEPTEKSLGSAVLLNVNSPKVKYIRTCDLICVPFPCQTCGPCPICVPLLCPTCVPCPAQICDPVPFLCPTCVPDPICVPFHGLTCGFSSICGTFDGGTPPLNPPIRTTHFSQDVREGLVSAADCRSSSVRKMRLRIQRV